MNKLIPVFIVFVLGACSTAPSTPSTPNYGGDASAAAGKAWINALTTLYPVSNTGAQDANRHDIWVRSSNAVTPASPIAVDRVGTFAGPRTTIAASGNFVFIGSPAPGQAFYYAPGNFEQGRQDKDEKTEVMGLIISNVTTALQGVAATRKLIYRAAYTLTEAQLAGKRRAAGIPDDPDSPNETTKNLVDQASLPLQKIYFNSISHPTNFNLTQVAMRTNSLGTIEPLSPLAIID